MHLRSYSQDHQQRQYEAQVLRDYTPSLSPPVFIGSDPIFHSDQQEIQQQNSTFSSVRSRNNHEGGPSREDVGNRSGQSSIGSKFQGYDSSNRHPVEDSLTPDIPTRNILQFFWKVVRNFFTKKQKQSQKARQKIEQIEEMEKIWGQVVNRQMKPSLTSFTKLFKDKRIRPYFRQLFRSRYFLREIVASSLKAKTKITYLRYVKILLKGFLSRELKYLN